MHDPNLLQRREAEGWQGFLPLRPPHPGRAPQLSPRWCKGTRACPVSSHGPVARRLSAQRDPTQGTAPVPCHQPRAEQGPAPPGPHAAPGTPTPAPGESLGVRQPRGTEAAAAQRRAKAHPPHCNTALKIATGPGEPPPGTGTGTAPRTEEPSGWRRGGGTGTGAPRVATARPGRRSGEAKRSGRNRAAGL